MLTQTDLEKIQLLMRSELKIVLRDYPTRVEMKNMLSDYPTRTEMKSMLSDYPTRVEMNNKFDKMIGKMNLIISFFDKAHKVLEKRVERVEQHLRLS
jgi:hypothetical protein